jgi:hypothetical protein
VFQFLYPLGLLAAAGMIIPVLIHLWNIKNGKTLKIGSIALLGSPSNQRSRNFKINDWPLLLLRCLLLLWLACLLAKPSFKTKLAGGGHPGWLMVEKEHFPLLWKNNKTMLDSLLKKGYLIKDFNTGFQELELKDTASVFSKPDHVSLSYFSLLKQLNTILVPGTKVYLFTTDLLERFKGEEPQLNINLHWQFFNGSKERVSWVVAAFPVTSATIKQQIAYSAAEGTFYRSNKINRKSIEGTKVDTAKLRVLIYGKDGADAHYVKAAVQAIATFTERPIQVREIQSLSNVKQKSLVFWLSAQNLSDIQLKKIPPGSTLLSYAPGKQQTLKTIIRDQAGQALQDAFLLQRIPYNNRKGQAVWTDGYGIPVLTADTVWGIKHYQFYSRFNQNWTDLVWTNGLVRALLPLVLAQDGFIADNHSRRVLTKIPDLVSRKGITPSGINPYKEKPVSTIFWWLLLGTFMMERLVAYKRVEGKS